MCIRDSSWLERTPDKGEVRGSNPRRPISQRYFAREERAQGRDPQRDSTWHSAGGISSDGRAPPLQGGGHRFDPGILHFRGTYSRSKIPFLGDNKEKTTNKRIMPVCVPGCLLYTSDAADE